MIVLGINSKLDGHDPAAALFVDGVLVAAAEEERFLRKRHAPGSLARHSVAWCLRHCRLTPDDVDLVTYGWEPSRQYDAPEPDSNEELLELILPRKWFPRRRRLELLTVPHHQAHAAVGLAYATSPQTQCVVVDGAGEREAISVWSQGATCPVREFELGVGSSLGAMYQALSTVIGLGRYGGEGKAMGLSAHGQPVHEFPCPVEHPVHSDAPRGSTEEFLSTIRTWVDRFTEAAGSRNSSKLVYGSGPGELVFQPTHDPFRYRDLAASGQARFEDSLRLVLQRQVDLSVGEVAFSGGASLNCLGVGRVAASLGVVPRVPFSVDDAGVAIGSALVGLGELGIARHDLSHNDAMLGPSWGDSQVCDYLESVGLEGIVGRDRLPTEIAERLGSGAKVAIFDGPMEFGPRALGHRSILADPLVSDALQCVNNLKRRQWWRPLCPVIFESDSAAVFGGKLSAPFMAVAFEVPDEGHALLGDAVHVDGTTRPQVLADAASSLYADVLRAFRDQTERVALINTSMNVQSPIVCSMDEALNLFYTSALDAVALGPVLLTKQVGAP